MRKEIKMKTDYVFGDEVRVLKQTHGTEYRPEVKDGDIGFVLSCDDNATIYPVEVQFVGFSECFMFNELEFVNSNIEDEGELQLLNL